jgi:hypothetical protein
MADWKKFKDNMKVKRLNKTSTEVKPQRKIKGE